MTDKWTITRDYFFMCVAQLSGDIESNRWRLAELAVKGKESGILEWAEIIASHKNVRRSPHTVRQWANAARLRAELPKQFDLPITFYIRAVSFADRLSVDVLLNGLQTAVDNPETTAEDLSTYYSQEAKVDKPLENDIDAIMERVVKICEREGLDPGTKSHLEGAVEQLRQAAENEQRVKP